MSMPFPPSVEFECFNVIGSCLGIIVGMYNLGQTENADPYVNETESTIERLLENPKVPATVKENLQNCLAKLQSFVEQPDGLTWEYTMVGFQSAYETMFPQPSR
jgi:hypothetical protein